MNKQGPGQTMADQAVSISPFRNESECVTIGGLTFENRNDRVIIYGNVDITRDQKGLVQIEAIRDLVCSIANSLNSAALINNLPESVDPEAPVEIVDNPFGG